MGGQGTNAASALFQPFVQLDCEHHVGEFALAVRLPAVVAAFSVEVIPTNRAEVLSAGRDRDHPRSLSAFHQRQHSVGECEVSEVIDGPLHLMALLAQQARWCHHSRVVDQQIQSSITGLHLIAAGLHAGQVSKIQVEQVNARGAQFQQLRAGCFPFAAAAAGHQHRGTSFEQGPGCLQAQSAVGACHKGNAPPLIRHVVDGPAHAAMAARVQFRC